MTPPLPSPAAPEPHSQPVNAPSGGAGGAARAPRGRLPDPVPGERYGSRVVICEARSRRAKRDRRVLVRCDCGHTGDVYLRDLLAHRADMCQRCAAVAHHAARKAAGIRRRCLPKPPRYRAEKRAILPCANIPPSRDGSLAPRRGDLAPGPALAALVPLDPSRSWRPVLTRVEVLTGRVQVQRIGLGGDRIWRMVDVLVEGETDPRAIAVEWLDPAVIAAEVAEQSRPAAVEVWA